MKKRKKKLKEAERDEEIRKRKGMKRNKEMKKGRSK